MSWCVRERDLRVCMLWCVCVCECHGVCVYVRSERVNGIMFVHTLHTSTCMCTAHGRPCLEKTENFQKTKTSNFQKQTKSTIIQAAAMSPKTPKTPKSLLLIKTPLSARYPVFRSVDRAGGGGMVDV